MKRNAVSKCSTVIALTVAAAFIVLSATQACAAGKRAGRGATPHFTSKGELMMPKNYRHWVFVGAPVTPNDMNNGKAAFPEFHHVYIDPKSYAAYTRTGEFPDGTMLVKELATVGSKTAASGNGYFAGDLVGVAAAVKDSRRFAKEPGYWAYFSFTDEKGSAMATAKALPTASCNPCHQQNGAQDWVFTQYYPVLRAARAK